jgi:2',3'-cyclic-nucleotide 2'-phosphodiesterase (5'-nucleotidase family)
LYLDAGDVEETTTRISNLTKGTAMHRLLAAAGCDAAAVGNAAWLRYGPQVLAEHAKAASYPILCANLVPLPGAQPSALLGKVGIVGLTDPFRSFLDGFDYGLQTLDEIETAKQAARSLQDRGAELVIVLSHLGYDVSELPIDDQRLAQALQGEVDLIVGAHSHNLLPDGERIGDVLVVQAGSHGTHLGRVEISDGTMTASVIEVPPDTPAHAGVLAELEAAEAELGAHLQEVLGDLPEALDQEAAALWLAGIYRERMRADVGLATPGVSFDGGLSAGPLTRGALWEACHSSGNPGVVTMSGEQLQHVIERGRDTEFALTTTRSLRGRPRGILQVSGADVIEPAGSYAVAGCDFELEPYGGMVEADWGLEARYDYPTILREAIEEHLRLAL